MEEPKLEYRIGWVSGGLVISVAVIGDLLQVLLSLTLVLSPGDDIVTVAAEGFITLYLNFKRVSFFRGKRALGRVLGLIFTWIIELVPIVDALPTLTADAIYNIHSARSEDRTMFKEAHERWVAQMKREQDEEDAYVQGLLSSYAAQGGEDAEEENVEYA